MEFSAWPKEEKEQGFLNVALGAAVFLSLDKSHIKGCTFFFFFEKPLRVVLRCKRYVKS